MKKNYFTCMIFFLLFLFRGYAENSTQRQLTLEVGGETIVKIQDLKGISNPGDIVEDVVLTDGNSFKIRGLAWGDTQLTAWDMAGNQWVYSIHVEMPKYVRELQGYLEEIEGVNVNFLGKNIIVEGQLLRKSDDSKLQGILANFGQVKNMVNTSVPEMGKLLMEAVKSELYNMELKYSLLGEGLMYEGYSFNGEAKEQAKTVSTFYFSSIYPAVDVKTPNVSLELFLIHFKPDPASAGQTPFKIYTDALQKEKTRNLSSYTFFDSKSVEQAVDKINKAGTTHVLTQTFLKTSSHKAVLWEDKAGSQRFFIQMLPKVIEPGWIDIRFSFGLDESGKNLFMQTDRLVLKNKQPASILGLWQRICNAVQDKALLFNIPLFQALKDNAENAELLLLISPSWNLKD